ncbi:MAG: F0F1 ATP synthase subunit B [Croceitalea sp.]|nr:F0F1 ATP synthase subunit B [Croceitalea sp.]MBT8238254.1 F0F1 ATP synthase subunit B [Croceitalea sp.]NNC33935.1 F0F1 ATP synthase subunit B [Croceitalea sp.]NNL08326.1 F0F1 ATP synthase subunit B [Croceitalea sp.]NNM18886.1 F0F1 ATP synthase subunit B [Croceitalea sp.]
MDSSQFVTPGFGLVFWTAITFIFLLLVLRKFAWKPILGAVSDREESIKSALESAEEAKKEMQNLQADNERILKEARAERDTLLKEARELKEGIISDAKEQAKVEGDKMIKQAQAAIESEKKAAVADIKAQVANLSVEIAEKVIKEELSDKKKQLKLVENMLGDIKLS